MSFDFLSNLWFLLIALVWGIYIAQEMFISGVGMLSSRYSKEEKEFKFLNRSVGTHWDGIQVWLILAVGGTFAAFPNGFATLFTGLYIPVFLLLYVIIIRGISIELIDKTNNEKIRSILKKSWFVSSFLLIVVLALYLINLFVGLPIQADGSMNDTFASFLVIFNMVALFGAAMFVVYSLSLGALYIKLNASIEISSKLDKFIKIAPLVSSLLLIIVMSGLNNKIGIFNNGLFIDNLWLWIIPIATAVISVLAGIFSFIKKHALAFASMILAMILFIITGFLAMMPNFINSTIDPNYSLTIQNASANLSTLEVMFYSTLIFLPIVIGYQAYKYIKFWRK